MLVADRRGAKWFVPLVDVRCWFNPGRSIRQYSLLHLDECWLGVLIYADFLFTTCFERVTHAFIAFYGTRVVLRQILRECNFPWLKVEVITYS